jgi:hypothetical protein
VAISCAVPVNRASLLVWRVKGHEKALPLLASRVDLVKKRVAGRESRVEEQELALLLPSSFLEVHTGENGAPGVGPEASGGESGASGP